MPAPGRDTIRTVSDDELGHKLDVLHRIFKDHPFPSAVEDLPPDGRDQLAAAGSVPEPRPLLARVLDEVEDAGLDSYGELETLPLLHFLSQYPVAPYSYDVSPGLTRGERPSVVKLQSLAAQGYQLTVSLCAEMPGGDSPLLLRAGWPGSMRSLHIPVVDMHNPTPAQVIQLLDLLTAPDTPRTYLHCEAGRCRTGVMVACYRMAVQGWDVADAYAEAENFGCSVPQQKQFILLFGTALQASGPGLGRYPLRPLGSVQPTSEQRAATLTALARQETGQPE
jgi:hypothetical protein